MAKRIYGLGEAAILVLLGATILWFALSANYNLLMNARFRWLTLSGAGLALVMGSVALSGLRKRSGINVFIFALMMLITFLGKPYMPDANSKSVLEPPLQAGMWNQIDQTRFPQKDLQALCMSEAEETYRIDASFTTVGVAKRLNVLDKHGSFALMTTVMYCCVADAFAVGLRVPYEDLEDIEDDQWIMVSGMLVQDKSEIKLPNFRFRRAMLSSINKTYYLQPEKIMSYNRVNQLPLLTDQLSGQTSRLFRKALEASGLLQVLEEKGPFTVFVPVDQAIENLDGPSFEELTLDDYKQLVSTHVVRGKFLSRDLMKRERLETINSKVLQIAFMNGKLKINQSRLLLKNTEARNGVIHFIYPAILPDKWQDRQ